MINLSPQRFSRDGFQRLTTMALYRTHLSHLNSEFLASGSPELRSDSSCGLTEWSGEYEGNLLSLGWDWRRLDDGALVGDFDCGIRTNVMLTCAKGYDLGQEQTASLMMSHICSLPWQAEVAVSLRDIRDNGRLALGGLQGYVPGLPLF